MTEEKTLTTSDKLFIALKKYKSLDEITPEVKNKLAQDYHCSKALVQKIYNRLREATPEGILPRAEVPAVKVEKEPEVIIEPEPTPEIAEEAAEAEALEEKPEALEGEKEEELPPSLLEEEEVETLKAIWKRSIKRLMNVPFQALNLEEFGISDQEAEDTSTLLLMFIIKYAHIEATQYMLEITGLTHFGSLGARIFVEWRKRQKEKKRLEEARKEKPAEPKPEETPEPKAELTQDEKDKQFRKVLDKM